VVSVAETCVSFHDSARLRYRIEVRRGTITFNVHNDFQRTMWMALWIARVHDPILAKCDHLA